MRSTSVVVMCVLASILWLLAFAMGARVLMLMPVIGVGGALVVILVLVFIEPVRARLKPTHAREFLWGIAVGGVSLGATYALYPVAKHFLPFIGDDVAFLYRLVPVTRGTIPVVVLVIIAEELLWRGALLDALRADHPAVSAVILASTSYAAAQLGLGVPLLAGAALLLGLLWAAEAVLTRSLIAPLISHAMWTLTVFGILPLEHTK
jgi:membrane protease YdiL (CAAX protease family)